jgi:hypothetical protein
MPTYSYECRYCGQAAERVQRVAQRHEGPRCCGWVMPLVIMAPAIRADNLDAKSYFDHGLGERITSRSQRKRLMAAHNLVEADPGNIKPHGAKGTVFSFAGQAASSVPASGAFARRD